MKKLMLIAATAISVVTFAVEPTGEAPMPAAQAGEAPPEGGFQKQSPWSWFEAEFSVDLFTAYVYRNAVFNDEAVIQPCISLDFVKFDDWVTLGGFVWQNWNLTNNQRPDGIPNEMNETDYNVHLSSTIWESEDENYSLDLELGHEWFTYRYDLDTSYEIYLNAEFVNPIVTVYGRYAQAYSPASGCYFEFGLKRECSIGEVMDSENEVLKSIKAGIDWNLGMGSERYMANYLYEDAQNGVSGTTIRFNLGYDVCEFCYIGLTVAYTGVLNGDARDATEEQSYRELCWGGLQAKLSF